MGNFCCYFDNDSKYTEYTYFTCSKCNDTYKSKYSKYSERRSCRIHELDENNYCKGCRDYVNGSHNCYHY